MSLAYVIGLNMHFPVGKAIHVCFGVVGVVVVVVWC
jgi:hypothetical protein